MFKTLLVVLKRVLSMNSKLKISPLPNDFIPSKKDCPTTELQIKEVKIRFGNLHYRSVIGALLYISCCTRPDIAFAVNKLAKYSNNPGVVHYRAMLHLIGYLKGTSNRSLKFYSNLKNAHFQHIQGTS